MQISRVRRARSLSRVATFVRSNVKQFSRLANGKRCHLSEKQCESFKNHELLHCQMGFGCVFLSSVFGCTFLEHQFLFRGLREFYVPLQAIIIEEFDQRIDIEGHVVRINWKRTRNEVASLLHETVGSREMPLLAGRARATRELRINISRVFVISRITACLRRKLGNSFAACLTTSEW